MADTIKTVCAAPFWVGNTAYTIGARVNNDTGKIFECITAGTSAASGGPTGTTADITDGTAHWKYIVTANYTSLNAWEAQNLTLTAGNGAIAECYGGGVDTTGVTIGGWTTVATGFITIRTPAAERHAGKWDTSKYCLSVADANGITINEEFVRLEGIQAEVSSATGTNRRTVSVGSVLTGSDIRITNCIIRGAPNASYTTAVVYINDADINLIIRNTLVQALTYFSTSTYAIQITASATALLQNVTAVGGSKCYRFDAGTITMTNCIGYNSANADFISGGATPTVTNCASKDATADDWGGTGNRINQTFAFVDAAGGDFHLASNDTAAKDQGADLSATFTDDIDGQTRSGSWDIGADEYVASTTTVGNTRSISWDLRGHVGNTRAGSWSVRSRASTTRQASWSVRTRAGNTRVGFWSIRKLASTTRQPSWSVRTRTSNTRAASWSVRSRATATRQASWGIRGLTSANRILLWNVLSAASYSQVGNARGLSWTVRSRASNTRAASWSARSHATTTRQASWGIRGRIANGRSLLWNVQIHFDQVGNTRGLSWAVRKQVGNTRAHSWSVRSRAQATRGLSYAVRRLVGNTRSQAWSVRTTVSGSARDLIWSIIAFAGNSRNLAWDQQALTGSSRVLVWSILPPSSLYQPLILGESQHGSDLVLIMPDVGLSLDPGQTNLIVEVTA